ncbi:hypothetical protein [Streptosporangium sp. 'caverna']|uniref:hypothetical protein n=1 Tax=Streptosporangium sp. 'caverna' TaxID=2202249 RepID=UPI0013A6B69C|nr:hypothetical protein [Streptosporangium sp. 'caverna']
MRALFDLGNTPVNSDEAFKAHRHRRLSVSLNGGARGHAVTIVNRHSDPLMSPAEPATWS